MIAATCITTAVAPRTGARTARSITRHTAPPAVCRLSLAEQRSMQRRLDRWELQHLRQHAAELAERLEAAEAATRRAEEEAQRADDAAEFWREQALNVDLRDGECLGLTVDGTLQVVDAALASVFEAPTHSSIAGTTAEPEVSHG